MSQQHENSQSCKADRKMANTRKQNLNLAWEKQTIDPIHNRHSQKAQKSVLSDNSENGHGEIGANTMIKWKGVFQKCSDSQIFPHFYTMG